MERLLLHVCCGVCSIYPLEELSRRFEVKVYFYNPNIQPLEEYERRLEAVKQACELVPKLRRSLGTNAINLIEGRYEPVDWFCYLAKNCAFDWPREPEGGRRCQACFRMRLEETACFAKENGFDWFATTLTVGRNKRAEIINAIGREIAAKYGLKFYEADWKKQDGVLIAHKMAKEKNIYRQNYCGCVFSLNVNH